MPSPSRSIVTGKARRLTLSDSPPNSDAAKTNSDQPSQRSGSRAQLESLRRITAAQAPRTIARPPRKQS